MLDPNCTKCGGIGKFLYSHTGLWRKGGIHGQAFTEGPCDICWGSGDSSRPWINIEKLEKAIYWLRQNYPGIYQEFNSIARPTE